MKRIIRRLRTNIYDFFYFLKLIFTSIKSNKSKIFLIGTPEYYNIGDIAIMEGEINFIEKYFSNYNWCELSLEFYRRNKKLIKFIIRSNDVILITGGGYLGNMWIEGNEIALHVLRNYKINKIIIMPSTIHYLGNNKSSDFVKDKVVYESHKNLLFILREEISYKFVIKNISLSGTSSCYLAPDMALFIDKVKYKSKRLYPTICLRKDKEQDDDKKSKTVDLLELIKTLDYKKINETDTAFSEAIKPSKRKEVLKSKLEEFGESKFVITDRLHGMIFCYLTETPCIVIPSKSHKIRGVYKWIQDSTILQYNENVSFLDLLSLVNEKVHKNNQDSIINIRFNEMAKIIEKFILNN